MSHLSIYYTWRNFKAEYGNTQLDYTHIPSSTNVSILIPDGSYSVEDINNFIHHEMLDRKHENTDGTFGINVYANAVYNRITIDVSNNFILALKAGIRETLGFDNTQTALTNGDFNGVNVPQIERVNNVLVHCNLVNNTTVYDSSIIHAFVPNNSYGNILEIAPNYPFWRKTRNSSIQYIEVWFTDQDNRALEIEDNILVELQIADKSNATI